MVNMKYINEIREFLKDPKKKAITQLGLYFIFFVFVFLLLNNADGVDPTSPVKKKESATTIYKEMTGYTYKVTYTSMERVDVIEGTYYDNKSLFTYNNFKYYLEDSLYIIDNDSYSMASIEYNISKIFSKNLYTIFEKLKEESKTTYTDGTIVTNYILDSNEAYKYLNDLESDYSNKVSVSITEKDDIITKVSFNLVNLGLNLTNIDIEYYSINNIESLEFNKENYIFKESL